jgi:hypothetical protein
MTCRNYTECLYIIQRWKSCVLRTRGGLTPYLKLGGCAAVLLRFAVTGATSYQYRPATPQENTPWVVLEIAIEGIVAEAIVDTGGVYLLCHPRLARQLDMDASQAVCPVIELLFRGVGHTGLQGPTVRRSGCQPGREILPVHSGLSQCVPFALL